MSDPQKCAHIVGQAISQTQPVTATTVSELTGLSRTEVLDGIVWIRSHVDEFPRLESGREGYHFTS